MDTGKFSKDNREFVLSVAAVFVVSLAALSFMGTTNSVEKGPLVKELNSTGPDKVNETKEGKFWIQESYEEEISNLSPTEYHITQENGTEPAFRNEYYDHKEPGIYVDVVSGEPLFSSKHKYDSGTGWPAFYRPLEPDNIIRRKDPGPFGTRVEVASKYAGSHLGHIFEDGPEDKTGLRYCINSAALEFIPADKLEERGYGQYSDMFNNTS